MQNHFHNQRRRSPLSNAEADFLAGVVRTGLKRRGNAPTESEALRMAKALTRLQPAALSALANSPPADPAEAFSTTLQSLRR